MGILINKDTKVIIQGITGREGSVRTKYMKEYGTKVVGGTSPGKAGESVFEVPVFNTVKEIVREHGEIDFSVIFVPGNRLLEAAYRAKIAEYDKEVARYKKEKNEIMGDAKKLEASRDQYQKHGVRFGEALILLQIGILLSSLASISKNHVYWYGGAAAGVAGVAGFIYALAMAP